MDNQENRLNKCLEEIVELKIQLHEAKITADLWMKHAFQADEASADLKLELADTRRNWGRENQNNAKVIRTYQERERDLESNIFHLEQELIGMRNRLSAFESDAKETNLDTKISTQS